MSPAVVNILFRHLVGGLLHGLSAALQDLFKLPGLLDLPERFLELGTAVTDLEDGVPERHRFEGVVIALRAERDETVFADREIGQPGSGSVQGEGAAGEDQLEDQHKRHDGHSCSRIMHDTGDKQ